MLKIEFFSLHLTTTAATDVLDLTSLVQARVAAAEVRDGLLTLFTPGSTAALTTIEFEPGVVNDLKKAIDRLIPKDLTYDHDRRWGDGNGYAHVCAALFKPDLAIPVENKKLTLGTWQQIVLLDFDNRPRERTIRGQLMGTTVPVRMTKKAPIFRSSEQRKVAFADNDLVQMLFGQQNQHLRIIDRLLQIKSNVRGNEVILEGPEASLDLAVRTLESLYDLLQAGYPITGQDVQYAVRILRQSPETDLKTIFLDAVFISALKRRITPKSLNQKNYLQAIRTFDMVFGIGPAGTGKTYLAMAMAVAALINNECSRIVLTRPAVEAGEKLGFLPGDLYEKVNPYLRPLYDALNDMMDFDKASQLMQRGVIEVAPLAFMRGRTLNNAFVILDEAQNTTSEQMMMFLTRLGFGSKAVITGDITQIDLPAGTSSGLKEVREILTPIEGIAFIYFNKDDVVRHPLVQDIILAYEQYQQQKRHTASGHAGGRSRDDKHDREETQ